MFFMKKKKIKKGGGGLKVFEKFWALKRKDLENFLRKKKEFFFLRNGA